MVIATPTDRPVQPASTPPEHHDVVVVGGGQAGLATGYYLAQHGLDFVILDAHQRVGDAWRQRWDSLRLFTPARLSAVPGMPLPGPRHRFPTKDELADYLEAYAGAMRLPVRTGIEVTGVSRAAGGGWYIETSDHPLVADAVVIATGGFPSPTIPSWAGELDPAIVQLHSSAYRNPTQLQPGAVLVVGASHSGADIAVEAVRAHPTILAGRDTGQVPIRTDGRLAPVIDGLIWFMVTCVLTVDTPMGRKAMKQLRAHGFPLEHPSRSDIAAAGVERITERVTGTRDGKPLLADGRVLDVRNVVWCTGFHGDYGWIEGVTRGEDGYPIQRYGVVTDAPGLSFIGLKFQTRAASSLIGGVGRDAHYVADHIAAQVRQAA